MNVDRTIEKKERRKCYISKYVLANKEYSVKVT